MHPKISLLQVKLNQKMNEFLCDRLLKDDAKLLNNKNQIQKNEIKIPSNIKGFDSKIIITSKAEIDNLKRFKITMSILTYNSKLITKTEMIFNEKNEYEEGTFVSENTELVTEKLIDELIIHKQQIIENLLAKG